MPARPTRIRTLAVPGVVVALGALVADAGAQASPLDRAVERRLVRIVETPGGPPGAIATLHRNGRTTVLRAGRADVRQARSPRAGDAMRIASVAKAFSGAVALRLVERGELGLDDTVGQRRPDLPAQWGAVTVRQLLGHTSGIPDYTRSAGFARQLATAPRAAVAPATIIDWVRTDRLSFAPGERYRYSNTDNIVVALIAEAVSGRTYDRLLHDLVIGPAGLRHTSLPTTVRMPSPRIRGYVAAGADRLDDVTTAISPTGAWASGGILSTPSDLGRFIRSDLGGTFFGAAQQDQQLRFVRGSSSPPGPGRNAAGLAIFRYVTRCGTVYGHTGSFPGYTQWVAATRDGTRSVTTTFNLSSPSPRMLGRIRAAQTAAVCALLRR